MTIAAPGRRLLKDIKLPFVARKVNGGGQRSVTANLSLTSMIDFLVVTVVFLLMLFQPGQSAAANGTNVPSAINVQDAMDAPMLSVVGTQVLLDGKAAGTTRGIDRVQSIEDLSKGLTAKRDTWKQVHPDKPFPGAVVLQLDQDVPSIVVKSLFHTAAHAGYPSISFMVERGEK